MRILTIVLIFVFVLLNGCTSIRSMEGPAIENLRVGELVTLHESSGRVSRLYVTNITDDAVSGRYYDSQQSVTIDRGDIRVIEAERIDYVKSAAAGVGGIVVSVAALFAGLVMLVAAAGG